MPDRVPKPISTVAPSPPWLTTRTSVRPLAFMAAATPVATAGAFPNNECSQAIRQEVGVRGGEHLKTPGGIDRHELPVGCPHRGIEGDAGTECLSAARAGAVAAGQRVRPLSIGLDGALVRVEQAVSDREATHLVELH